MIFRPKDRVEHILMDAKGTVISDDGNYVIVAWDDGKTGALAYSRDVNFSAHQIQKLVSIKKQSVAHNRRVRQTKGR
jgi:hypothetical protein